MRQVLPYALWIGHAGDARDLRKVLDLEIAALVDLALIEKPAAISRELVYCRFPLLDGTGNAPWLLRAAVVTTASLLGSGVSTLVCCSAGMSRSVSIAAAALAVVEQRPPADCLMQVVGTGAADVSPGLWNEVSRLAAGL